MNTQNRELDDLHHIKHMMERSSRFISLSGLSGISAGLCALVGTWLALKTIAGYVQEKSISADMLEKQLLIIAACVLMSALVFAFIFTYMKSKKHSVPLWGAATFRMLANLAIPLAAGGFFVFRLLDLRYYVLITPTCLLFYGVALVNVSKYTFGEIRYLGFFEILLGIINLWLPGYGLIFWSVGFGVLHIIYGCIMWWKYERAQQNDL